MPKRLPSSCEPSSCPPAGDRPRPRPFARALITLLRTYRLVLAPALPATCRFAPSCSAFAIGAIEEHGAVLGTWLAARRVARVPPDAARRDDPVAARPPRAADQPRHLTASPIVPP